MKHLTKHRYELRSALDEKLPDLLFRIASPDQGLYTFEGTRSSSIMPNEKVLKDLGLRRERLHTSARNFKAEKHVASFYCFVRTGEKALRRRECLMFETFV